MRVLVAMALVAACGRHKPWLDHDCNWGMSVGRDAIVYADEAGLGLRRDGRTYRMGFHDCLARAADRRIQGVVPLSDGWSALVYGYRVRGGNWTESGSLEDKFSCIVDFRAKTARALPPDLLRRDLRHFVATAGARTGWLYRHDLVAPVVVIDLAAAREAPLPDGEKATVFAESGTTLRTVEPELVQTDPEHPIYRSTLIVRDYDTTSWPPTLQRTTRIPVGGRTDRLVLSTDGKWVAYDGAPYTATNGPVGDLGLVDLTAGKIGFELLAQPGRLRAADVVGGAVLVAHTTNPYGDSRYAVAWRDARGGQRGKSVTTKSDDLTWSTAESRIVVNHSCAIDLVDLPPPK